MSIQGTLLNSAYTVGGGEVDIVNTPIAPAKATYTYYVNAENMVLGDVINIRQYIQAIDADTPQVISQGIINFSDVENEPMITSFPVVVEKDQAVKVSFEQTSGTVKDWNWRIADVPV